MSRPIALVALLMLTVGALCQDTLVFEAEDVSSPQDAWGADIQPVDEWNLWSTDEDAERKWSGGIVLQSPRVLEDREKPEDGAPVLHTVISGIPAGVWRVRIKHGRSLAVSLDGEEWTDLSKTSGNLGKFESKDGKLEFWVDDRFKHESNPGFSYYDCIYVTRAMPEKTGVANGDFEAGDEMPGSAWGWFSRDGTGSVEFSQDAHEGKRSVEIVHDSERDWALSNAGRLDVKPGQTWIASAWIKCQDTDGIDLAVVALSGGKTMRWDIGSDGAWATRDWKRIEATAYVPKGCDQVYVRLVGSGKCLAWVDEVAMRPGVSEIKVGPKPQVSGWAQERAWEKIGRGVLAMPIEGGKVYVGWRLLNSDPKDVAFNVYRATGRMRPVKLTAEPLTKTTDFVDDGPPLQRDNAYWVRPVVDGKELDASEQAFVAPSPEVKPCISLKLDGDYTFQKAGIADLNGDGRYDYVIKQPRDNIDPYRLYWTPSPDSYRIEAYLHDGTFLWRNDLGWAIERGIWYSPYVVWDLDGDGKAEVAVKTGEGDPREEDGRVCEGPEYVSIWDGMTGKELARADWPSREGFGGGRRRYNYSSRNQMGIAYLDGRTPCLLVARGTYTVMKLVAYQYQDGKLEELCSWDSREEEGNYRGQGAHFMHAADVDGDGRDEVMLGSCVIDDNGDGLWTNGKGHPDHCYLGDIDPSRPGLEVYYGYETSQLRHGCCLADAKTGEIIWGIDQRTYHVHASGLCADFDALHPGMECYSGEKEVPKDKPRRWLHTCKGELLATEQTWDVGLSPRAVYWDADPQRELLGGRRIWDYLGGTHTEQIEGGHVAWADILGDWREEIITSVAGELRIYTSTIPATDRRVCLMQDPIYRLDVAHLAMGYPQPPMTSFYIGNTSAALGLRLAASHVKVGERVEGKALLTAAADAGLAGVVRLEAGEGASVEPSSLEMKTPAGGLAEGVFSVTVHKRPAFLSGVQSVSLRAEFEGANATLQVETLLRIEDEPLKDVPMAQAEDFCAQDGGEVHIREDKVGAVGRAISHWDSEGHRLSWKITVPRAGKYVVVLRYCCPADVQREMVIDDREPTTHTFPNTGGFGGTTNDWSHATALGADSKPLTLDLGAGEHVLTLTNTDGKGMNLDYIVLAPQE